MTLQCDTCVVPFHGLIGSKQAWVERGGEGGLDPPPHLWSSNKSLGLGPGD